MTVPTDRRPATRREVYAAVALVWMFLMLIIANSLRSEVRWSGIILFAGAAVSAVMYLREAYRSAA